MLWDEMDNFIRVSVWLSEYTHMHHLWKVSRLVHFKEKAAIEAEIHERGVIWNRNKDVWGSEDLYIETAINHVETLPKAKTLRLQVISLLEQKPNVPDI